jgi:DNA polymerase III subunit alpha
MPAVAVTDTNNMFAALEFSVRQAKPLGRQGCSRSWAARSASPRYDPAATRRAPRAPFRAGPVVIVLLAQDEGGLHEPDAAEQPPLYIDGVAADRRGQLPQVTLDELARHADGPDLPDRRGRMARWGGSFRRGRAQGARADGRLATIYPDRLYVELQRHPGEGGRLPDAEALAERGGSWKWPMTMGLPLVATNDVYFPKAEMYEAHDALICIAEGAYVDQQGPRRRLTPQHYFKSESEMCALFADLPEALENTVEIARRCAFAAYKARADPAEIRR